MKLYEEQGLIHSSEITKRRLGVNDSLTHHGILGQKWGIRRFQNKDGTLTEAGKKRYYENYNEGVLNKRGERLKKHVEKLIYFGDFNSDAVKLGKLIGEYRSESENNFLKEYNRLTLSKSIDNFVEKWNEEYDKGTLLKEDADGNVTKLNKNSNNEEHHKTKQTLEKDGYKVNDLTDGEYYVKTVESKHGKLKYNVRNPDNEKGYSETNDNLKAIKKFDANKDANIEKLWSRFMKDVDKDEKEYYVGFSEGLNINLDKHVFTKGDKVDAIYFKNEMGIFTIKLDKDGNYKYYSWDD